MSKNGDDDLSTACSIATHFATDDVDPVAVGICTSGSSSNDTSGSNDGGGDGGGDCSIA